MLVALAELPAASAAVQVIVVVPSGNVAGASLVSDTTPTASVAVAVPCVTAVSGPVASAVTFAGGVTTGAVVSATVTTNRSARASLPAASWAEQVTVVAAMAKIEADAGEHSAVPSPSTASCVAGLV